MVDNIKIGRYLAELRRYYKITQDELANRLGVSRQAVSKWETGSSVPDVELLIKISELYSITVNDIICADISKVKCGKEIRMPFRERQAKKIMVIGCGRWGTFLAWYLDKIGHKVTLYGRGESARMRRLCKERRNDFLNLSESIQLTYDLKNVQEAEILIVSVNSQNLQELCEELKTIEVKNKAIVLCMKGIEIVSGRRLSQVADDILDYSNAVAVWLGPGHVQEFCRGVPNCMVIDSSNEFLKDELIKSFSSELIRFYYGGDLIGNEIGAAAKNVIGIAAGMLDGMNMATLKGALMARGTKEIGRLIMAMGGKESSVYGLCHLGDYEATIFSRHSQNRAYGEAVVSGRSYEKLAEGYYTVSALRNLGKNYGVELPICEAVYQILYCEQKPISILDRLFSRNLKNEN